MVVLDADAEPHRRPFLHRCNISGVFLGEHVRRYFYVCESADADEWAQKRTLAGGREFVDAEVGLKKQSHRCRGWTSYVGGREDQ